MKFLIQTIDNKIGHDFAFTLIESLHYQNWITNTKDFTYKTSDFADIEKNIIPVGSVEFVTGFLIKKGIQPPKPINVPRQLMKYLWSCRKIINGTEKDIVGEAFVKSNDKIKSFTEITNIAPKGNYQISEVVEIESEWRAFIYKNELVGLKNYSGGFDIFPNVEKIKKMINEYTDSPIAYTLDVGVHQFRGTFVINRGT